MMRHRFVAAAGMLAIAFGVAMSQAAAPSPGPASAAASTSPAAAEPSPLKIHLMDGSLVTGKISVADLTIETQFGTLKVPIDAIKSFAPGLSSHPEFARQLSDLVNDLGADGFAERENAQKALTKMGSEIAPELRRELKTAEAEKQTRLQKILEEFDSQRDADEEPAANPLEWTRDDVIVTGSFTMVGHITTPGFAVSNSYGTLQLKLGDIRRALRDSAGPQDIRKNIAVSGNLISTNSFESALQVNKGDRISITASGTITMSPWGGNASSGPDGAGNYGSMGSIPTGALIAKIGTGSIFKAGSKYSFVADKSGLLQFGIAMPGNYQGNQFPGDYQVKIQIIRK